MVTETDIEELYPAVREIVADALAVDEADVRRDALLIDDLGAESIDFLDIVYQLERKFAVPIPRGRIEREIQGDLTDEEFAPNGVLGAAARERLRTVLPEAPSERIVEGLRLADLPRLFTVETFCRIVARARREVAA